MTDKTISLSSKAYNLLRMEKRENESFSEAIIRLIKKLKLCNFLKSFGALEDDLDVQELEEFKKEAQKAWK